MAAKFSYPIIIDAKTGRGLSAFIRKRKYDRLFILCDSNTLNLCLGPLVIACPALQEAHVIELEPGEGSKELNETAEIWRTLTENQAGKKSLLLNLGGGVVTDIGGFAASVYKRGIDFVHVSTSLLAMADASIGGKTGINFAHIKNQLGIVTQPAGVFIYTSFLKTLSKRHLINGYAEILKMALILDKQFFKEIAALKISDSFTKPDIIKKAILLKRKVVEKDPFDAGLRGILNFGHSVGHALESLYIQKPEVLLHGEAVAMGMAVESCIAFSMKRITGKELQRIVDCLQLNFQLHRFDETLLPAFFSFFKQDKKHKAQSFRLSLLNGIGHCGFDIKVSRAQVEKALTKYNRQMANAPAL